MDKDVSESILSFLRSDARKLGTVSTVGDGGPAAATVYYTFDEHLAVYFITRMGSRKYTNILKNPKVAFCAATENPSKTLQLEGIASVVSDPSSERALFPALVTLATERNALPPVSQTYGTSEIVFVKITPTWVRIADFEIPSPEKMFQEIAL